MKIFTSLTVLFGTSTAFAKLQAPAVPNDLSEFTDHRNLLEDSVEVANLGGYEHKDDDDDHYYKKDNKGFCEECPYPVFYTYRDAADDKEYLHGFFINDKPAQCTLAAIRDDHSRKQAQYAIPDGKIAITQGYFPIKDYKEYCIIKDGKTLKGRVKGCKDKYYEYFVNWDESYVVYDGDCWVDIDYYDLPDGLVHAAIGADGLLRPVFQWSRDIEKFGYDGGVYECCPKKEDICPYVNSS